MTVSSEEIRKLYDGDGVTTVFPYTWKIYASTDLKVIYRDADGNETELTLNTHYTVSGVGNDNGGNVTLAGYYLANPPASGTNLLIILDLPLTQLTDYVENDKFPAESHEEVADRAIKIAQILNEKLDRALLLPMSSSLSGLELPEKTNGEVWFRWNDAGDEIILSTPSGVGLGDMLKATYDQNDDGIVDKAAMVDDDTYSATAQELEEAVTKLAGIESAATADQTGAEIKALYEAEADTNAFTDAEKAKLASVEESTRRGWIDNCVNKGPVDSDGRADFLAAGSGLSVALDGTPTAIECLINSAYCKRSADDTIDERTLDKSLSVTNAISIRYNTSYYEAAGRIPDGEQWGGEISSVILSLYKIGTPTGNIWVEIREDNSGEPGSLVTNGQSSNVDVSTLVAYPGSNVEFTFSTNPTLDKNTTYWIVVNGDWPVSVTDYALLNWENAYGEQFGVMRKNSGGSWVSHDADGIILFNLKYAELADDTTAYLFAEKPASGEEISDLGFTIAPPYHGYVFNTDINQIRQNSYVDMRGLATQLQIAGGIAKAEMYGGAVSALTLRLKKNGSPTGDVWVEIRKDSSGLPGDLIDNGTSATQDVSTLSLSPTAVEFTFSISPILLPNEKYWIVFNGDYTTSAVNNVSIYYHDAFSSNWAVKRWDGDSWEEVENNGGLYLVISWEHPATDQHWFDMTTHKMKRYTGDVWEEVERIFLGEAVTASGSVSSALSYALRGEYVSEVFAVAASTAYEKTHNIGVDNRFIAFEVFGFYLKHGLDDIVPLRPVRGDGDTNGYIFTTPTTNHKHIKVLTHANPVYDDAAWQTSGYYYIRAKRTLI